MTSVSASRCDREEKARCCAFTNSAFQKQATARLLRETMDHRQTQPRPFADSLGREERLRGTLESVGSIPMPSSVTDSRA